MTYVSAISLTWMHETRRDRFVFPQTRNFGRLSDDCQGQSRSALRSEIAVAHRSWPHLEIVDSQWKNEIERPDRPEISMIRCPRSYRFQAWRARLILGSVPRISCAPVMTHEDSAGNISASSIQLGHLPYGEACTSATTWRARTPSARC
jgi:hypothetical protein